MIPVLIRNPEETGSLNPVINVNKKTVKGCRKNHPAARSPGLCLRKLPEERRIVQFIGSAAQDLSFTAEQVHMVGSGIAEDHLVDRRLADGDLLGFEDGIGLICLPDDLTHSFGKG